MEYSKILPLIKGAIKHIPGVKSLKKPWTGGTIDSDHCFRVWLTHLTNWSTVKTSVPRMLAELGPGDSLGTGFAALLSGCECVYALDVIRYWDVERNLKIFDELVELFNQIKETSNSIYNLEVNPEPDNYKFILQIISKSQLDTALAKDRLKLIRKEIINIEDPENNFIKCKIPWYNLNVMEKDSLDFIFSNAVLEHVEDLETTYKSMNYWLKQGGIMSHYIDFQSHGILNTINGHWTFSDLEWKIVKGGKPFLLNRQPFSSHLKLHTKYNFTVLKNSSSKMVNTLSRNQLANRFKDLTNEDLTTSEVIILSQKL